MPAVPCNFAESHASSPQSAVRFRERCELLDFLLEVSAATAETLDLDQLLANVAEIVAARAAATTCSPSCSTTRGAATCASATPWAIAKRWCANLSIALGEGITGAAAARREPVLVGDVRNDPRYLNAVDAVRTELAVPMIARGRLVGVIDLQSTRAQRLYRIRPRAAAADRRRAWPSPSTTRGSIGASSARTAP